MFIDTIPKRILNIDKLKIDQASFILTFFPPFLF